MPGRRKGRTGRLCSGDPSVGCRAENGCVRRLPQGGGHDDGTKAYLPQVLVTDELGGEEDAKAVMEAAFAGVKVLATVHGQDENDLMQRHGMRLLIQERVFERYLVLGQAPGRIVKRLDQRLCPDGRRTMKLALCIVLFACSSALGYVAADGLRQRCKAIETLQEYWTR